VRRLRPPLDCNGGDTPEAREEEAREERSRPIEIERDAPRPATILAALTLALGVGLQRAGRHAAR